MAARSSVLMAANIGILAAKGVTPCQLLDTVDQMKVAKEEAQEEAGNCPTGWNRCLFERNKHGASTVREGDDVFTPLRGGWPPTPQAFLGL